MLTDNDSLLTVDADCDSSSLSYAILNHISNRWHYNGYDRACYPTPLYYISNPNHPGKILIMLYLRIFSYNIESDSFEVECSLKSELEHTDFAMSLDQNNDIIHIIGGNQYSKINLKTMKQSVTNLIDDDIFRYFGFPTTFYIKNKLYVFGYNECMIYDTNKNDKIEHFPKGAVCNTHCNHIICVESQNIFLMLGQQNECKDKHIYCNIDDIMNNKWNKYDVDIPIDLHDTSYIVGFDNIIFLFCCDDNNDNYREILCLDTWNKKIFKSHKKLPIGYDYYNAKFIKINGNCISIMTHLYHFRVSLQDMIPNQLQSLYDNKYNVLMNGYSKDVELYRNVSSDLIAFIISFCGILC